MPHLKLTESSVKAIVPPLQGQTLYRDTTLQGFGVRASSGGKVSFFAEGRIKGKTKRVTIGPVALISVAKARTTAQIILSEMVQGIDRNAVNENAALMAVTLSEAFVEFKAIKKSTLTDRTLSDYDDLLNRLVSDWMKRPWVSISQAMVLKRHAEIGAAIGGPTANHIMRTLSSVINFAMRRYRNADGVPLIAESPTAILGDAGAWFPERARDSYIKPNQLKAWWGAVQALDNETARDLLILLLLTGFRTSEGKKLQWRQVDLENRTITLEFTKNGKKHVIPIGEYLHALLSKRKEKATGEFVFPGTGKHGYLVEPKKNIYKVAAASKVPFTAHDLRRTFSNCLESADVTYYAHKKLMNHSVGRDVTGKHYLSLNVERLREPMEKVNRFILRHAGVYPSADIVQLPVSQVHAIA